jgi:hypothetical protein
MWSRAGERVCLGITLLTLMGAIAASASATVQPLASLHMGVPTTAPAPAGGATAQTTYTWERCAYWSTDTEYDGTYLLYPLGETGSVARDIDKSTGGGNYVGPHPVSSDGPLTTQGGPGTQFDGHSSKVAITESFDLNNGFPFSIEVWARPRIIDGTYRYLFSRERTLGAAHERQGTGIWLSSAGLGFERWVSGTGTFVDYAPGLPVGKWSQVVATFDGHTMRLFVNGVQVGSHASQGDVSNPTPGPSYVGAGAFGTSGFFAGDLADAVIFIQPVARAHVANEYADANKAPCTSIAGASGATYTPTLEDLGRTLSVTVASPGTPTTTTLSREPVSFSAREPMVTIGYINDLIEGQTVTGAVPVTARLYGLPGNQVTFSVDGQLGYAKAAEAPYQYLWDTTQVANGPHTVSVSVDGLTTQVSVNVEN